MATPATVE